MVLHYQKLVIVVITVLLSFLFRPRSKFFLTAPLAFWAKNQTLNNNYRSLILNDFYEKWYEYRYRTATVP